MTLDAGFTDDERYAHGTTSRREMLSDAHVDRANASTTELSTEVDQ